MSGVSTTPKRIQFFLDKTMVLETTGFVASKYQPKYFVNSSICAKLQKYFASKHGPKAYLVQILAKSVLGDEPKYARF